MDYFLNEYSIRGQFKDREDFFEKLRDYTLPVLKKIESKEENIIWKKETFWQLEICNGIRLHDILMRGQKNENSPELLAFKAKLIRLCLQDPFFGENSDGELKIKEYKFDMGYREKFDDINCFSKALESEGRIISFFHPEYKRDSLPVTVIYNDTEKEHELDNIWNKEWWKNEPEIKTRRVSLSRQYKIEVRAKEFEYHPPHFHVTSNEFKAVFNLKNGEFWRCDKEKWSQDMINEIKKWYEDNKEELKEDWESLHGKLR